MNQLVYTHEGKAVNVPLTDKPVSFGRGDAADHRLPDKTASRVHAQFLFRGGQWCVEDLESANGTLLNGKKIAGVTAINPGDVIKIGATDLKFEGEAPKPPGEPESEIPRLLFQPDPKQAPIVLLIKERVTIGRKTENSLQIDNKGVSGIHVEISRRGRKCTLIDLDSSNGTTVGDKSVKEHVLLNGDVVVLGKVAKLYFIDPLGKPVEKSTSAPALENYGAPPVVAAPKPSPVSMASPSVPEVRMPAPSSAAGASDRGTFSPVGQPQDSLAGSWGINLVLALLVAGALLAGGWALSGVFSTEPERTPGKAALEALSDAPLSFEGEVDSKGNPTGWQARFEAPAGGKMELASDPEKPGDGARSLRIKQVQGAGAGMLILTADKPRDYDFVGAVQLSMLCKGEGVSSACVACALEAEGRQQTLVAVPLKGLSASDWTEVKANAVLIGAPPKSAKLVLSLSGSYSRIWIDRVQLTKAEGAAKGGDWNSGDFTMKLDAAKPSESVLSCGKGGLRFSPRVLTASDTVLSEQGFWAFGGRDKASVAFLAALPARGAVATLDLQAEACSSEHLAQPGMRVHYSLRNDVSGASLALDLVFDLPGNAIVMAADMRGTPLIVDLSAIHGFPFSTVSELAIESQGLCVSFRNGAVVWFQTRGDKLVATVRAAPDTRRHDFSCDVYKHSVAQARLYARAVKEGEEYEQRAMYSAALARFHYVLAHAPADLPCVAGVKERVERIEAHRNELYADLGAKYATAKDARTLENIENAARKVSQFLNEFPGDAAFAEVEKMSADLSAWRNAARPTRPPEEIARANMLAEGFLKKGQEYQRDGHILLALTLFENVVRDYADTPSFKAARSAHDEIMRDLQDPAKRDAIIDKELAEIDSACEGGDWANAMQKCQNLFKRFPDTARNRDIMKRVRRIEERFD